MPRRVKRTAIFIPAYNEERSIGSTVLLAKKYGKVFVVDDGSKDATSLVAARAGANVIRREKNGGYGAAMKAAYEQAKLIDAGAYVFLDGDFQHDPNEIPKVAAPVLSGKADLSLGSRFRGKFVSAPEYRKHGVRLINTLAAAGNGKERMVLDSQCGFRALSKKAIESVRFFEDSYAAGSEIVTSAAQSGLRIVEVPVSVRYYGEKNGGPLAHGAGLVGYLLGEIARRRPLVFFVGSGFLLLALSALLGIFVVKTFYSTGALATGSAFLTVFTGIAGLVLMLIGINLYTLQALVERRGKE